MLSRAEGRRQTGDFEGAREYYMRALARFGDDESVAQVAGILLGLSEVERNLGEPAHARLYLERAISALETRGERVGLAAALNRLGLLERESDRLDAALEAYERSLAIRTELRDEQGRALTFANLGALQRMRGDLAAALQAYSQAAELYRELGGDQDAQPLVYQALRQLAEEMGDDVALFEAFCDDRKLRQASADAEGLAALALAEGEALAVRGYLEKADEVFAQASDCVGEAGGQAIRDRSLVLRALVLVGQGLELADLGDGDAGRQRAAEARRCLDSADHGSKAVEALSHQADLALVALAIAVVELPGAGQMSGDIPAAKRLRRSAETTAEAGEGPVVVSAAKAMNAVERAGCRERRAVCMRLRARSRAAGGDLVGAGKDLRRSLDLFEQLDLRAQSPGGNVGLGSDDGSDRVAGEVNSARPGGRGLRTVAAHALGGLPCLLVDYGTHLVRTGTVRAGRDYLERALGGEAGEERGGLEADTSRSAHALLGATRSDVVEARARLEFGRALRRSGQSSDAFTRIGEALERVLALAEGQAEAESAGVLITAASVALSEEQRRLERVFLAPAEETRARLAAVDQSSADIVSMSAEDLCDEIVCLRKLQEVARALGGELDTVRLLSLVVDCAIELSGAERGFLISTDEEGRVGFRTARRFEGFDLEEPEIKISNTIAGQVLRQGEAVICQDASTDVRWRSSDSVAGLGLKSVAVLPLRSFGRVSGVLYLDHRLNKDLFSPKVVTLLESVADHAAIALSAAERHRALADESDALVRRARDLESVLANQTAEIRGLRDRLRRNQQVLETKFNYDCIIGKSPKMREVFSVLDRVVESHIPVMVYGESGTGKELVARAIHFNSPRKEGPFVSENFAALSDSVLESELFGHVRGAFTGAQDDRKGIFESASGGTLFLDEVGDISDKVQKELLRVLQEGEVRPVGADHIVKVDVRIIAATNKDLSEAVSEGRFREDLYYRLNVFSIKLPPLRERREDVPLLVDTFLSEIAKSGKYEDLKVNPDAMRLLIRHHWPGNVRELRNVVERSVLLAQSEEVGTGDIELESVSGSDTGMDSDQIFYKSYSDAKEDFSRRYLRRVLERTYGNISWAARESGMLRQAFQRLMKRFDVKADDIG